MSIRKPKVIVSVVILFAMFCVPIYYYSSPPMFREKLIRKDSLLPRWGYPTSVADSIGNIMYVDIRRNVLLIAFVPPGIDKREFFYFVEGSISRGRNTGSVTIKTSMASQPAPIDGLEDVIVAICPNGDVKRSALKTRAAQALFEKINAGDRQELLLDRLYALTDDSTLKAFFSQIQDK